jgi:hypothetical protein
MRSIQDIMPTPTHGEGHWAVPKNPAGPQIARRRCEILKINFYFTEMMAGHLFSFVLVPRPMWQRFSPVQSGARKVMTNVP